MSIIWNMKDECLLSILYGRRIYVQLGIVYVFLQQFYYGSYVVLSILSKFYVIHSKIFN